MLPASVPAASPRAPVAAPPALLRGAVLGLACALCVGLFFRNQIANGFTLLLGDRHDAVIALSIMEHWRNVLAGAAEWSRTAYFHPVPHTLGYNDGYFLFGVAYAAFRAIGADPFLAGELTNMAMRAVGFLGMHAACRGVLGLPFGWSLLGAALFTLSNNLFIRASHAQLFSVGFLPVLATLLHAAGSALLGRRPKALLGWGAAFVLLFAAVLMTGFYMAWYFAFLAAATFLAWLALAGGAQRQALAAAVRAAPLPLAALAALAAVANLPFLRLYLPKAAETGMHPWEMALQHTPTLLDVLHVGEANLLFGWLVVLLNGAFRPDFPAWSERMTGLTPVLLLCFAAATVWLWRGAAGPEPVRRAWLQALALATVATWALTLRVGDATAWWLVWNAVPGAKAARVVARYQLVLAMPVIALAVLALSAWARRLPAAALAGVAALLLLEQANGYAPLFLDRPLESSRLRAVPPPPAECRAFWVSAARTESRFGEAVEDPYNHNTEAMLIASVLRLPTVNGISTFNPPGWPAGLPGREGYEAEVAAWAEKHGLTGLCALDLQRMAWRTPAGA
ncbi:hypothetical protein GCM10009416_39140 [Craurococcus roseus]|uniref:Glycosyltransferase RgtA/B/C/D-like domain-containing protein n=2 Tax=Craurococcus roseus TaxID=77585 RepID=A0ABP3QU71_9PROT